jgi:hypothetical protein
MTSFGVLNMSPYVLNLAGFVIRPYNFMAHFCGKVPKLGSIELE